MTGPDIELYDSSGKQLFTYSLHHPVERYEALIRDVLSEYDKMERDPRPSREDVEEAERANLVNVASLMGLVARVVKIGVDAVDDENLITETNGAILAFVISTKHVRDNFSQLVRMGCNIQVKFPKKPDRMPVVQWVDPKDNTVVHVEQ